MARAGKSTLDDEPAVGVRPATNPESRMHQVIAKAVDLAERQIEEGTASSQVITYFLKLGSENAKLETEKLRKENALLEAKAKSYQSEEELKNMYNEAIEAMRRYGGHRE